MDWQTIPISEILDQLPKGVATAVALLLIFLGYRRGTVEGAPKKDMEIAGAIVDNSAIFKLASAIEANTTIMARNQDYARSLTESFNRHSDEIKELTREIREGITAMLRSQR